MPCKDHPAVLSEPEIGSISNPHPPIATGLVRVGCRTMELTACAGGVTPFIEELRHCRACNMAVAEISITDKKSG